MNDPVIRRGDPGYRQCTVTVMDTTDPAITFNAAGESNHVQFYREKLLAIWNPEGNTAHFDALVERIKADGRGKEYDCLIGISGGVDSSYIAYLAWKHGLRPLIVHTDTGWNSELAVKNIENIVSRCKFDLITHVVDWPPMQDLQRAFFRAGVPNQDIPQDHAIFAAFYGLAAKRNIKWVLNGGNFASESILPRAWGSDAGDLRHILAIHRRFGSRSLRGYPTMGYVKYAFQFRVLHRLKIAKPLNLIRYHKQEAIETLGREFGWRYYGGKHYESRFTKFFQSWYLPTKFGFDKRLAHYSSLILSGQMTREAALTELAQPTYSAGELAEDFSYMQRKLGLTKAQFEELMAQPARQHADYPNSQWILRSLTNARAWWRS